MAIDLETVRAGIPALAASTYLNSGGAGPCSRRVTDAWVDLERFLQAAGPDTPAGRARLAESEQRVRQRLAATLNVDPTELAMTRNVAEGINTVAWGYEWQPGDEVLLTDQEHPTGQMPWLNLADRRGVVVRRLPVGHGDLLDRLADAIGPRTRLVAFSHVTCEDGWRLPAAEIVRVAHRRGVPVLFDGAQAIGQFPVDLGAIGCDFYAMTGHKWCCAGRGLGALYVRRDRIAELRPSWTGAYAPAELDGATGRYRFRDDAGRFEFGGRNWAMYASYAEALSQLGELGPDGIERRVADLAAGLKAGLAAVDGVSVLTPAEPASSTGIVTFALAGQRGADLVPRLWERHRIVCRAAFGGTAVRVSLAYFTSPAEVELVLEAVRALASERAAPRR